LTLLILLSHFLFATSYGDDVKSGLVAMIFLFFFVILARSGVSLLATIDKPVPSTENPTQLNPISSTTDGGMEPKPLSQLDAQDISHAAV
jgi:hypothetical protein